jgi:hypothetical protein
VKSDDLLSEYHTRFDPTVGKIGPASKILNHTLPLPSQVAAVYPLGTLAIYAVSGPGWKMSGCTAKLTTDPAATVRMLGAKAAVPFTSHLISIAETLITGV